MGGSDAVSVSLRLSVNGTVWEGDLDPRTSLLDALRDTLGVTSAKKGCDHGQCGACTVLADDRRIVSCLALAASYDGARVSTAEGLGTVVDLSELQQAFVDEDGLQCGFCTPGQVCSAMGMLDEARRGMPSHVSPDVAETEVRLTDVEIRERMSGNLCRCGAYVNIVRAIGGIAESEGVNR